MGVEPLEARRLLTAVVMTPYEQLLLELVNRARSDPAGEAARYGINLNEGLSPGTISSDPKQPLAPNQILVDVSGGHSADMLANDYFSHTNLAGQSPSDRVIAAGYPVGVGENISYGGSTGLIDYEANVYERHRRLFLSTGHRLNILNPFPQEVGTGVRFGQYTSGGTTFNVGMATENFGNPPGDSFLTGVIFTDASDSSAADNDFFDIGEEIVSGTITATADSSGQMYSTMIGPSGGYSLQIPSGTYTVSANGGEPTTNYIVENIVLGSENVKVDFETTTATLAPSTPALAVAITDSAISENGGTTTGTVSRSGNTSGGLVVMLSSDDAGEASVPSTVTILDGQTSAGFVINGVDENDLDGTQTVTIIATAAGFADAGDVLDVLDDEVAPVAHRFDFGTGTSPLEVGHTRVTWTTTYSGALGHGWLGTVNGLDRGTGTGLTRDLHYRDVGTFVVDVPNGTYQVMLTVGDEGPYRHDQEVFLEGASVETVATAAREMLTRTYTVTVNDGQLTLLLDGRGGVDPNMVISGLQVIEVALTPALAVAITDSAISENGGTTTGTVSRSGNTSGALVVMLSSDDAGEASVPSTVTILDGQTSAGFVINGVDENDLDGTQTVTIIATAAGFADAGDVLDVLDDEVAPVAHRFDFGTGTSPLEVGHTRVTWTTTYSGALGHGWLGTVNGLDRGTGTGLTRDLHYRDVGTFVVDVPNGTYQVMLTVGDEGPYRHDQEVFLEGASVETVATAAREMLTRTYTVTVNDGQLTLLLDGRGGVDPNMVISGLQVIEVALTPALAVAITDSAISENGGTTTGTVSRSGNTSGALVVMLSSDDAGEASVPSTVTILDGQTSAGFVINGVDENDLDGTQTVTIIATAAGFADAGDVLDVLDDEVAPVAHRFDFGTGTSPLEVGHTRVTWTTTYSGALGHGWLGTVNGLDRGTGTGLTRDLHYRDVGTFVVDVPNGTYQVMLTVGDEGPYRHDQEVFLEGASVETVATAAREMLTRTYTVTVNDGQLTLLLDGRGGVDPNMVISGLQVIEVALTPALAVAITDSAISENGGTTTGTVSRSGNTSGALVVMLSSDDAGEASVPSTVTILDGQTSAGFVINGVDENDLDGTQTVTIIATAAGFADAGDVLDVLDDEVAPVAHRFDFGTGTSPLEVGHTRVTWTTTYSGALGHGWLGTVNGLDRGTGTGLTRDLHYRDVGTFVVDVPNGTYQVMLTVGDEGPYRHDQEVFLEGASVETVATAAREMLTRTYTVTVNDGQLTLLLDGRGGVDPNMVISGLQVIEVALTPALAVAITDSAISENGGSTTGTVSRSGNTSGALVVMLSSDDAGEASVPSTVTILDGQTSAGFVINGVDENDLDGTQTVTIIATAAGFADAGDVLDVLDDEVAPVAHRFDFGTGTSPLEVGHTRVTWTTTYSGALGHGWLGTVNGLDRGTGTGLTRDLHYRDVGTFVVDVPNGTYQVMLTVGDEGPYRHDQEVFLEGASVETVATAAREMLTRTYTVTVNDGQLTLLLDGRGGVDPNMVISGLQVIEVALTPALAVAITDSAISENGGTTTGTVSRSGNTSGALVVMLSSDDAGEASVPSTVTILDGQTSAGFVINGVDENDLDGTQTVTIIATAAGFADAGDVLDVLDDEVAPVAHRFDFGTGTSPLEVGHRRVTWTTTYSGALGHGWLGTVNGLDRGTGTGLTRDLHYRDVGTFVVDVPNGTYQVMLTVGDEGPYRHDQEVFLEGASVETVATAAREMLTRTYTVTVNDGQLTLLLDGRGGVDPNMVISGLQVIEVALTPALAALSESGGTTIEQIAYVIDQELQLSFSGSYSQDSGGLNEKWMLGEDATWYFITPDGSLYEWNGTAELNSSTLLQKLDPSYHADPSVLHDASAPSANLTQEEYADIVDQIFGQINQ